MRPSASAPGWLLLLAIAVGIVSAAPVVRTSSRTTRVAAGRWFDRVLIINLENTDYADALLDPFLRLLGHQGVILSNYHGVSHPSQPNYVAQAYGSEANITDDNVHNITGRNLVEAFNERGVAWRSYQENIPDACYADEYGPNFLYARKHNPFVMFNSVRRDPAYCREHIVDATEFAKDWRAANGPQYMYYTPNQNNDGHDTSARFASNWLESFLAPLLRDTARMRRTLIFVTFDEREYYIDGVTDADNHVYAVMLGGVVRSRAGQVDGARYDHFSLLRMIEENWALRGMQREDAHAVTLDVNGHGAYKAGRLDQVEAVPAKREKREAPQRTGRGTSVAVRESLV